MSLFFKMYLFDFLCVTVLSACTHLMCAWFLQSSKGASYDLELEPWTVVRYHMSAEN